MNDAGVEQLSTGVRILMYSSTLRDSPGGVHTVYTRLATSLRRHGHTVTEVWSIPGEQGSTNEEVLLLAPLKFRKGIPTPYSIRRVSLSLGRLLRSLLRHKPDIVNIHFVRHDGIYFLLFRSLFKYKVVLSAHGSDVLRPSARSAKLLPHLFPRADAITAVTGDLAERVRAYPGVDPGKVHVIPNGVDCEFWSRGSKPPSPDGTSPVVVSVGRLTPVKGHDILIAALARLRTRIPGATLVIAGDGESRPELERLARARGVADATMFLGGVSPARVRSLLHGADVFALPSRSEGMPLALLQAMAAGVPSVAARVGGVPEIIEPGNGLLVPADDPDALCDALASILTDGQLASALSERARSRAGAFSNSVADVAYARLFAELAKRR